MLVEPAITNHFETASPFETTSQEFGRQSTTEDDRPTDVDQLLPAETLPRDELHQQPNDEGFQMTMMNRTRLHLGFMGCYVASRLQHTSTSDSRIPN